MVRSQGNGRRKRMKEFYTRYQKFIENIVFPFVLLIYPLVKINQGIDVSDTTYSLSNFQYFGQMNGTWIVATFLANAVGNLMMYLPLGNTLLGMNLYTALVQVIIALMVYRVLRKKIPAPLVAAGEFAALGLCWCPSVILYNYLTYLLMTAGILLLYAGILERREKYQRRYFAAAGICLGANVAVRMPNVVQSAFILAVWYGIWIKGHCEDAGKAGDEPGRSLPDRMIRSTLWCIGGYLIGFGIPLTVICLRYGWQAYPAMVQTMFAMTQKASDYKPTSMLTGMFGDYGKGLYWLLFAGVCMLAGWLGCKIVRRMGSVLHCFYKIGYVAVYVILLRFYWGRGMFSFRYYEYDNRCVYYPAVFLLLTGFFAAGYCLIRKNVCREQKVLAALVVLEVFLTPLGSNNALYPIINNLFLVLPFLLWVMYDWFRAAKAADRPYSFVWKTPLLVLCVFVLVQSIGFHMLFVFQDGIWGEKRDTLLQTPSKAAGVYTNQDNAEMLKELAVYADAAGLSGREMLCYGEIPGLGYLLDMPPALSTFWPDLDSYRMVEFERDLQAVEAGIAAGQEGPVIILTAPIAAYLHEDAQAMEWFGVGREKLEGDEKLQKLKVFMKKCGYEERFGNARYVVFDAILQNKE